MGNSDRNASITQRQQDAFKRQAGKQSGACTGQHGSIYWLVAFVVANPCIDQVDGNAFQRQLGATAGLAESDHQCWIEFIDPFRDQAFARCECYRQHASNYAMAIDTFAIERFDDALRRIDGFATEWFEAGQQYELLGFHRNTSNAISTMLTTSRASAVGICDTITAY